MKHAQSGYLTAYQQGMRKAIDEWPAVSTTQAVYEMAGNEALPSDVESEGWAKWYINGWAEAVRQLRTADIEVYKWERDI